MRESSWHIVVLIMLVVAGGYWLWQLDTRNAVDPDQARARFAELARVPIDSVVVLRHSNPDYIIGNHRDVVFELEVSGEPRQGRCTSQITAAMVCRLYEN